MVLNIANVHKEAVIKNYIKIFTKPLEPMCVNPMLECITGTPRLLSKKLLEL